MAGHTPQAVTATTGGDTETDMIEIGITDGTEGVTIGATIEDDTMTMNEIEMDEEVRTTGSVAMRGLMTDVAGRIAELGTRLRCQVARREERNADTVGSVGITTHRDTDDVTVVKASKDHQGDIETEKAIDERKTDELKRRRKRKR